MSAVTVLTKIGTLDLAAKGLNAVVARRQGDGPGTVDWDVSHRSGGHRPAYQGSAIQPRVLPVIIKPAAPMTPTAWDDATDAVLAEVDNRTADDPLVLTGPYQGTGVSLEMPVGVESIELAGGAVFLSVLAADPFWRAVTPTTVTASFSGAVGTMIVAVPGGETVRPTVTIRPTAQRTTSTDAVGWQWARSGAITNTAAAPLVRYPVRLDQLGDTAPLVTAGKMRADRNDLRVWIEGRDVAREVVFFTGPPASTLVWIVVPYLAPGGSLPFTILYGNPNAGPGPALAYPDRPAFALDPNRSNNSTWSYDVARTAANHLRGGWWLQGAPGNSVAYADVDVPGAFRRARTLPRPENVDDVSQPLWSDYAVGGVSYRQAVFDTRLYRSGAASLPDEGLADGVEIEVPVGIVSVRAGFRLTLLAETSGTVTVGFVRVIARQDAGEDWTTLYENTALGTTTVVPTTWTLPAPMRRVAFAVWPWNRIGVPDYVGFDRFAQAAWDTELVVSPDAAKLVFAALGAETAVFEAAVRIDGGSHALYLGAAPTAADRIDPTPGGRLALGLAAGGASLVVNGETRSARAVPAGATDGPEAPVAAVDATETTSFGSRPSADWLPLPRGNNVITVTQAAPGPITVTVAYRPGYS